MEPFRIIPTRRWLRSSRKAQEVNEKGDQLGILGAKPKAASPHPDRSVLAKEMEEFEKLMQLGSTEAGGTTDTKSSDKGGETKQAVEIATYVPDQPTTSLEPYEPAQPTTSPVIPFKGGQTAKTPEVYEPDQPTPVDEVYTPEQPTLVGDEKTAGICSLQNSEPYEPEQPTDEPIPQEKFIISAKAKSEVSEVEADMPQLMLDSGGSGNIGHIENVAGENMDVTPAENVSNSEGGNKSEQENLLPEVWLRKKEKKKKHSHHSKHKKPLVEWRLGVLRKDYVNKDFKSLPVDEKLRATSKHKWNDESEVEHLKYLHSGDGSQTDTSEVSGMTSPAVAPSDTELDSEQNTHGDIDSVGRTGEENVHGGDCSIHNSNSDDIQCAESNQSEGKTEDMESKEVEKLQEDIAVKESVKPDTGLKDKQPPEGDAKTDLSSTSEKPEDSGVQKDGDKEEVKERSGVKKETKAKSEREEEKSPRVSTRQSSRRARKDSDENKMDADHKTAKKEDDSGRRRSRRSERYRDDSDDERRKESDKKRADSDRSGSDTRRRSQRRDKYRDDSDDERRDGSREGRRRGRSNSRERRGRSDSRERRRYRDNDDRYDRYDRGLRQRRSERRSVERTDDRRSREDDRRNERNDSRERDDRRRKGKDDKDSKKDQTQTKEESKLNAEKKNEKADIREGEKLPEKSKTDSNVTDSDTVKDKDQNSKPNTSSKTTGRVPIKFNFTSRAVRRNTRSAVKAKAGVFDEEEDDDDRPLSELQNLCDEKEPVASSTESSEDHAPPVTRSKSREGPVNELSEGNRVSQVSPVHTERSTTRTSSSQKKENLFENTIRKDCKRDQESESDSGAELTLMGLGDAPRLYPENILESQVEMELLASAFSSTDTEAESEMEKVLDKPGGGDHVFKEGTIEDSPNDEEGPGVRESDHVPMEVEEKLHDTSTIEDSSPLHIPDKEKLGIDVNAKLSKSDCAKENSTTLSEETTIAVEERTLLEEKTFAVEERTLPEETTIAVEEGTLPQGTTIAVEERTLPEEMTFAVEERNLPEETTFAVEEQTLPEETIVAVEERTLPEETTVAVEEPTLPEKATVAVEEPTLPEEMTVAVEEQTLSEEMTVDQNEQSSVKMDRNEEVSKNECLRESSSIDEMLAAPEVSIPASDESHDRVGSEITEVSREEKELETSVDTEQSDVESLSLTKMSGLKELEDDFTKTESESDDTMSMEVIDLMAGTAYKTSDISVVLPTDKSDENSLRDDTDMTAINNKENISDQASSVEVQEDVAAVSQPAQPAVDDSQVPGAKADTNDLDHSTSDQNLTVQEADNNDLSIEKGSSEAACNDEMIMPSTEIGNESLPSEKDTIEVLHAESVVITDEIIESIRTQSSDIQSAKNADLTSHEVAPISTDITETSSTCEPLTAADEQPTRHIVQEGPEVRKRKRKSRWEAFVPEVPVKPPNLSQIDLTEVQTLQGDPSVVDMTSNAAFQQKAEEVQVMEPKDELMAPIESQSAHDEKTVELVMEEQSSGSPARRGSRFENLEDVDFPKSEEESLSPAKRVRTDLDDPIVASTDHVNQDYSTSYLTLDSEGFAETEVTTLSSGLDIDVNGAGDNQAMIKLEEKGEDYEAGIKEEPKDIGDFTKPDPAAGEDSMEEGELDSDVKEEIAEKPWDESTGMEQGEIKDDGEEEVEDRKREQRHRHYRQDKENIPQDEYWSGEVKREERDRPKEETRESREERRRKQYEEWGIVERSKMPRFGELTENYYLTERRRSKAGKEARRMVCCCTTSREERRRGIQACGEDCLNRVLMLECGSRCPCGDYCTNRRFQKREYARVGVFYAEGKGHGLKAKEDLKENEFVMEYVGEVLNFPEFKHRAKQYSKDKNLHFYFMALKADEIIDATEKGNVSRFMNHSCDPNCETQKWTVNGQLRVGFFTKRSVQAGEELTFDYQFEVYGQEAQKCLCGSEKCRGVIGKQKKQKEGKDTTPKRRGSIGEKRRKEAFTDVTLEDEIQQMVDELDECGLQSNDHTIALSRFMVRADQPKQRLALLKLLQETSEQAYLKYFLTHHGLRLLWSWMVDLGDNPAELQMQILRTLAKLPIPNKNALEDSKVLSVIERWAKDSAKQGLTRESTTSAKTDSDVDSSSASETPSRSDTPISALMASSLNVTLSIEKLKSIVEATSSESDMDNEAASGVPLALRQRLEAETTESPTSTASEEGESDEKPTSSAGEESQDQQGEASPGQPDSASDIATSSSIDGESVCKDIKVESTVETTSNETLSLESAVVDSTEAGLQETKESSDETSKEIRTLKSLAADAAKLVQSQNSCADMQTDEATSQSEDIVSGSSAAPTESVTDSTSESENRTTNFEQSSSIAPEMTDNEAESKTDDGEKGGESELASIISSLLTSWSDLKEIYRIPKKESEKDRDKDRDRDRDRHRDYDRDRDRRHDRDRDYDRDRHRDRDHGRDRDRSRDRDDRHHRDRSRDGDRDRHRDRDRKDRDKGDDKSRRKRSRSRSRERETKSSWSKDSDTNATPPKLRKPWKDGKAKEGKGVVKEDVKIEKETKKMSKEERRHLFEMQVEAKEREDAARKEQEALMMAQWQESEQQRQQQMAQYLDANGFPVDPNAPGMMVNEHGMPVNEHGMPIEVIPGHMGGMPMGEAYMGHPDMPHPDMFPPEHMHPDMQGQFPEHMQPHEHMGMEEGYPGPHMHEQHMMPPHVEGQPMYDDSGFPIPPQEHMPPGMMGMPPHEGMPHPGMDYPMHPDMDPNAMGHPHPEHDPHMMGAPPHSNMDVHLMGGQPHPGDPNMYPGEHHMMQPPMEAIPPQEMHVPQVVPIPAAGAAQAPSQPAPREEELMPPPSLPAPSRKSKKSKSQKSSAKSTKTSPPSTTYVAPAAPASSASPVLPSTLSSSSVAGVNPQGYPAQAAPGVVPVAQAPQVLQTPVLPQAPQQAAQTTFTFVTPDGMLVTQTIVPLAATDQGISPHVQPMQQHQQMAGVQQQPQVTESIPSPPAKPKTAKLPPNWKTAQDSEGKIYYYHSITRQTQWEMPSWDEEEDAAYEDDVGGGSNTPTYDEKARQKTTTAPADTSSEAAKRLKEAFRSKMSHHVVGYLNAYRKPDCKLGRITNTEDFKHLARKLTHGIMAKELKHCRNIEDLEVNENVKHKAKEYIKKYMGRYGKIYKKDPAESDI